MCFHLGIGERAIHGQEFAEERLDETATCQRARARLAVAAVSVGLKALAQAGESGDWPRRGVMIEGNIASRGAQGFAHGQAANAQGVFLLVVLFKSRDAIERHLVGKLFQLAFGLIDFVADKFEIALGAESCGFNWVAASK